MSKVKEAEIDIALAELVHLKNGENDALGKLLNRAIKLLKKYREERAHYQKLGVDHKKLVETHRSLIKTIRELS